MNNKTPFLSSDELKMLKLLVQGYTPKQMPKEMNLSYHTIKFYMRIIRAKFGATTTAQAVAMAVDRRLVAPE